MRFTPLKGVTAYDPEELEAPVTGAPVKGVTDGFIQTGRWLAMARVSLADLFRRDSFRLPRPELLVRHGSPLGAGRSSATTASSGRRSRSSSSWRARAANCWPSRRGSSRECCRRRSVRVRGRVSLAVALQRLERLALSERVERRWSSPWTPGWTS